jgi:hypothetical protein
MSNIGSSLDHNLKTRAQTLHANAAQLTKQEKDVRRETEGLRKETAKLGKVVAEGQRKVKELGNVQNWAEMLERDFLVVEETLRLVRNGNRPREGGSGDYEGSDWESSGSEWSASGDLDGERDDSSIEGDARRGKIRDEGRDVGMGGFEERRYERRGELDGEGDTLMDGIEYGDKGKGKETDRTIEDGHPSAQQADGTQENGDQRMEGHTAQSTEHGNDIPTQQQTESLARPTEKSIDAGQHTSHYREEPSDVDQHTSQYTKEPIDDKLEWHRARAAELTSFPSLPHSEEHPPELNGDSSTATAGPEAEVPSSSNDASTTTAG